MRKRKKKKLLQECSRVKATKEGGLPNPFSSFIYFCGNIDTGILYDTDAFASPPNNMRLFTDYRSFSGAK